MSRGGARKNAGRPVGSKNRPRIPLKTRVDIASQVLDSVDQIAIWRRLLNHKQARVSLAALEYLTDRVFGKATQRIEANQAVPIHLNLTWAGGPGPEWMRNVTPADPAKQLLTEFVESQTNNSTDEEIIS